MSVFSTIQGDNAAVFVFSDHGSNAVPDWVGDLGIAEKDKTRHIAWDIGTESIARALCAQFSCAGLICGFSRLVIDANRPPDSDGLIPHISDNTEIPGNMNLTVPQIEERQKRLYDPYHRALGDALDDRPNCLAISIHSFTPQLDGEPKRKTDIGLLVKDDSETAIAFIVNMREILPEFQIDVNQPYSAHDLNHTIDHNIVPRGRRHLVIELRQDHINTKADALRMAEKLGRAILPLI